MRFKLVRKYRTSRKNKKEFVVISSSPLQPYPEKREYVPDDSTLKAYESFYDTFVYLSKDKIIYLIGKEIEPNTELIYQISPKDINSLQEDRRKWGFDNKGIVIGKDQSRRYEKDKRGKYRVFELPVNHDYTISSIKVGFAKNTKVIWKWIFSVPNNHYSNREN